MLVGVPKEIKVHEYRVGLTPSSVREMAAHGHKVLVQTDAGVGIGAGDDDYRRAGAEIAASAEDVFRRAEMIVKVKEPQAIERAMLREGQILFTYLHLAPDPEQAAGLVRSGAICVAYETVTSPSGGLPLLAPMSEVAGRLAVQAGAHCLEKSAGGMGVLLGGVPGVEPGRIVILGAGVVGTNAAQMAAGTGAQVVVIDKSIEALRRIDAMFNGRLMTLFSNRDNVEREVLQADLLISGVLIPGDCRAEARDEGDAAEDEARLGDRRRGDRPGRQLRDVAGDDARRPDLRGRRRRPLHGGEHAGRGAADVDLRPEQRHAAVRAATRRQGLAPRAVRQPAPEGRPEHRGREGDLQGRGEGAEPRLHAGRRGVAALRRRVRRYSAGQMPAARTRVSPSAGWKKSTLTLSPGFSFDRS